MESRCAGFAELLGNPGSGGMTGHPDMHRFSALQLDEEESKERAEEEVGDRQEVARPDFVRMVVQEGGLGSLEVGRTRPGCMYF